MPLHSRLGLWRYLRKLPLVLTLLNHLINGLLSYFHSLHTRRYSAVDGGLEDSLADFDLTQAVVQSPTDVDAQLGPALQRDQHADVYNARINTPWAPDRGWSGTYSGDCAACAPSQDVTTRSPSTTLIIHVSNSGKTQACGYRTR